MNNAGNQACPAGLVGSTQTLSGIAMEIFKKLDMIPEIRIILKKSLIPDRSAGFPFIPGKQGNHPFRKSRSNFFERVTDFRNG